MKPRQTIAVLGGVMVLALAVGTWITRDPARSTEDRLLLLVPDGTSFSDPRVTVWLDAGSEEGLHVVPVHDSRFLRPVWGDSQCAGLILPDSVHQQASDLLVANLHRFVASGGKLMLVYDAGTFSLAGRYAAGRSRLSDLAGVDYALYERLGDKTMLWDDVKAPVSVVQQMEIPPGKYYPFHKDSVAFTRKPASAAPPSQNFEVQLRRYQYGDLRYPSFVTSGDYDGQILFRSGAGVVAGEHRYQKGSVLFVNLPLGYLKANTDGLLLHAFLKYFAVHTLSLPYLTAVPDGVGGLVLNWHVDSNAAIKPLQEMASWGLLQQGRYSIHITAGPDAGKFGDKKGFDVEHNSVSRNLILQYVSLGDQIGSHGGWIHDYFAAHVSQDDPKDLEQFLALNKGALEEVTGKSVVEYSAPDGDQPPWVTRWLESHGFLAYYFTGDTGMGPTEGYRDGAREGRNIWAFPILHLDQAAAFEEMSDGGYSTAEIQRWLEAITQFVVGHRAARLLYFHPPGILEYKDLVTQWMENTARIKTQGRFRWYTMAELARFLNTRKQVNWKVSNGDAQIAIEATHPQTLEHQAWQLSTRSFSEPIIVRGAARVVRDNDAWIVVAGEGKDLEFVAKKVSQP